MELQEICAKAVEYSGERCISHIIKNEDRWIIRMCDRDGHELFSAPVAIDRETNTIYDYSPSDDKSTSNYEAEDIPIKYQSKKGRIMALVLENNAIAKKYIGSLDTIYEKYNLYDVSPYVSYSILSYYCGIFIDLGEGKTREEIDRVIMSDSRTLGELIEEVVPFGFNSVETNGDSREVETQSFGFGDFSNGIKPQA